MAYLLLTNLAADASLQVIITSPWARPNIGTKNSL